PRGDGHSYAGDVVAVTAGRASLLVPKLCLGTRPWKLRFPSPGLARPQRVVDGKRSFPACVPNGALGTRTGRGMGGRAVFLATDGTLIEGLPYNVRRDRIRLLPGGAEGLRRLHPAGYRLIVVSNQSGVAHGYFAEAALAGVERRLRQLLAGVGVPLAGFFY